jgi:predicted nicotinamide N-methyase
MASSETAKEAFLSIGDTPVYFEEDWDAGIGGGLWSTGLALATYLSQHTVHARSNLTRKNQLSLLELGSGNGFLSVCFAALSKDMFHQVVITDTEEHLPLIQRTIEANKHIINLSENDVFGATILKHQWGEFPPAEEADNPLNHTYDLIVGSDLAYRDELHDPLINSLHHFSNSKTITLLGVTMVDTKPIFFAKLKQSGFCYERLSDHLLDPKFRGTTFGIFVIQKSP